MVRISGGEFLRGKNGDQRDTLPAFYLDRTEVTNAAYQRFLSERRPSAAGLKRVLEAPPDYPVANITIADAREFCRWDDKRLPTAKEWERAARGTTGLAYPWGNEKPDLSRVNVGSNAAASVTKFEKGDSVDGVQQLVGNVMEIVDERITPDTPENLDRLRKAAKDFREHELISPPPSEKEDWYGAMGGSFRMQLSDLQDVTWDLAPIPARFKMDDIGFRCAKDAKER